jgi:signal peptidase II
VKTRTVVFIIAAVIIADQALKIWVKTNMYYGGHITLINDWFRLYFIENAGMAWGWKFGGDWGKMALTLFRLVAVIFGVFYIRNIVRRRYNRGFIVCVGLIFAGALGNLIDSLFYGMIFDKGMVLDNVSKEYMGYAGLAKASFSGYSSFLHGNVVDMLYVPIIENKILPSWIPFWGGESFTFFSPIFNIADASISVGVITILLFQKKFFPKHQEEAPTTIETSSPVSDTSQIL